MGTATGDLIGGYLEWLRSESESVELDGGWTLRDLRHGGFEVDASDLRRRIAAQILRSRGLSFDGDRVDGRIAAMARDGDFPSRLHDVFLSMMALGGMARTPAGVVAAVAREDVEQG